MLIKSTLLLTLWVCFSSQLSLVRDPTSNSWGETVNDPERSSFATSPPRPVVRERYCFPKGWPGGVYDWRAGYRCLVVECQPLNYVCPNEDTFTFHRKCMACNFMKDLDKALYVTPNYDYDTNEYRIP
ncbi:uncharacterized protein LOC108864191 [Galendromus occidentalis]|uniref:Uncharacterized protein LOC108864191 n=1 Tax=Galendromus occidentalis TaxID=34638 RepID=A0AAJ7P9I1_9ACAR|nr:uncharacterized protein LOC108864191 [Galendromus occidentalis]